MSVNVVNKSTGALTKVAGNAITEASGINYSHTTSGMSATNVQDAIDESYSSLKSGLTNYERDNNWRIEAPERKNHYDYNSDRLMYDASHGWWLDSSVNKIASGGNTNYTWAVKCYPNTTYTVSLTHTSTTFRVAYGKMKNLAWVTTDDTPKNIYGLQSNSETGDVSITITTGSDATYLFIQIGSSDVDTAKLTLQVEIGDTATAYAPYIPSVDARLDAVESDVTSLLALATSVGGNLNPKNFNFVPSKPISLNEIGDTTQYENRPSGVGTYGILFSFKTSTYIVQLWISTGMAHRLGFNNGANWSAWYVDKSAS